MSIAKRTATPCPSCGSEYDRDSNASLNALERGFSELWEWPEDMSVEAALPMDTHS